MAEKLRDVLGLDLRSLAAFRIALGALLLVDLAIRATDLVAHYTDDGVLPRVVARAYFDGAWRWSIHSLSGSTTWQVAIFSLAATTALCLLLGYFTRWSTILSWLLVSSLSVRNPLVENGGDTLLRMLLFWSIFLPLGAVWSQDARRRAPRDTGVYCLSVATVALIIQICLVYWSTGLFKWNEPWISGDAIREILAYDAYARPLATTMLDYPGLLRWVTWLTLALELIGPLLLFSPWRTGTLRLWVIAAFVVLHLGIESTMTVGLFTWVSLSAWCALLPASVWSFLEGLRSRKTVTPASTVTSASMTPWPIGARATQAIVAILLAYVIAWNVLTHSVWPRRWTGTEAIPMLLQRMGEVLSLQQHWTMFYRPPRRDGWHAILAHLEDGRAVDLERDETTVDWAPWDRPTSIIDQSPNHRWRKLRMNLVTSTHHAVDLFRHNYCEYLVRRWNMEHPEGSKIATVQWYFMRESDPIEAAGDRVDQQLIYRLELSEPPVPDYLREAWKALRSFEASDQFQIIPQ